jgi:tight adherence protein C
VTSLLGWAALGGAAVGLGVAAGLSGRRLPRPLAPLLDTYLRRHHPDPAHSDSASVGFVPPGSEQNGSSTPHPGPRAGWTVRVGRPAGAVATRLGLPNAAARSDLALLGVPAADHVAQQLTAALCGLVLCPALVLVLAGHGNAGAAALAGVAGAAGGYWLPAWETRRQAQRLRTQLRHALSVYLDLTVLSLGAGAGIDQALSDAAGIASGWAADQLAAAVTTAQMTRTPAWSLLAQLGEQSGVTELASLAAAASLAGSEGARIRVSLQARATSLRARLLAETETQAQQATELMTVPLFALVAGFTLLIVFPALAGVILTI